MNNEPDTLKGKLIVGIDLGTTKSAISVWDAAAGRVIPLKNAEGCYTTPSMVGWDRLRREWVVGQAAKDLAQQHPGDVVYSIKRFIGRWFTDPNVLYGRQDLAYQLVSGGGTDQLRDVVADFGIDTAGDGKPLRLTAPAVSAKVLFKLRQDAARALGIPLEELKYAVVTVPAYFNVLQRRATIEAGKLAGLEVVDILNEPTAAALAYASQAVTVLNQATTPDLIQPFSILGPEERRFLVYDLGGGTFDISLLEASHDETGYVFYTRLVDGDTRLGGDDIDTRVTRWLASEIERCYGHAVRLDDQITWARLRQAAEQAKIELSTQDVVKVDLPALDLGSRAPFDAHLELIRTQLEACALEVLQRTRTIVKRAIEEVANLGWEAINEVLLVGGPPLMPAVQREVENLTGRRPRLCDKPQLAVALGAGEYAHILSLGREKFHENALINVIALPLGIRLDENTFHPVVAANVTVPHTSRPFPVTTVEDYQKIIHVEVLQGPRNATQADQCVLLGSADIDVPPAPQGTHKFEVVFDVQSDGTMKVIVTDARNKRPPVTIDIVETRRAVALRDRPPTDAGDTHGSAE